jgi:large subunit ribosomal protein L30
LSKENIRNGVLMAQLRITWIKSCIGRPQYQRRVIKALGLRRLHHSVIHGDTPTIRGMVQKVGHLLTVEVAEEAGSTGRGTK